MFKPSSDRVTLPRLRFDMIDIQLDHNTLITVYVYGSNLRQLEGRPFYSLSMHHGVAIDEQESTSTPFTFGVYFKEMSSRFAEHFGE